MSNRYKRIGRKVLKITGVIFGIIILLLIGFHFWFVSHARSLLEETVSKQSGGKIKLSIRKLHYNYFSRKMVLDDAVFFTTDTATAASAYRFSIPQLRLQLKALLPLLLDKKLLIDSLSLQHPEIKVTTLRYSTDTSGNTRKEISIPYEMGRIYRSIRDGLTVLNVSRFQIENGRFVLENKADKTDLPLRIGNIDFQIDNLRVEDKPDGQESKILFSDNIVLKSTGQHIIFPDGRHSLSFRKFRINLRNQLVEFDSCTIAANRKDSAGSSFRVFFDSLRLTHIDFDTLYKSEVIKADSVYCINPAFSLYVDLGTKKKNKATVPKLEDIIEQFTGNMELGYVGVKNGDFNIRTVRDGKPSSFVSRQNNFDMEGLQVDQKAGKPIRVKRFAMAIRNYENFIRDSSYRIRFDSILFRDDRITLSNFLFEKLDNGKIINSFSVPQFSLGGLSWDNLVFEKKITARLVYMYEPHISYTASLSKKAVKNRQGVFQSLGTLNEYMDLDQLDIEKGNIDLHLGNNLQVRLNDANLSVRSNALLTSHQLAGIRNALNSLDFADGNIQAGPLRITMKNIRYAGGTGMLQARQVGLRNEQKDMQILLNGLSAKRLLIDEHNGNIDAAGLKWESGSISGSFPGNGTAQHPQLLLQQVTGGPTDVDIQLKGHHIKSGLTGLYFGEWKMKSGQQPEISKLFITGNNLDYRNGCTVLTTGSFRMADQESATFENVNYSSADAVKEDKLSVPYLLFVPDIQSLLNGKLVLKNMVINKPFISSVATSTANPVHNSKPPFPEITINALNIISPRVSIERENEKGRFSLHWNGDHNRLDELAISGLSCSLGDEPLVNADSLQFSFSKLLLHTRNGRSYSTGDGMIAGKASHLHYTRHAGDNPEWALLLDKLTTQKLQLDSIGKNNGTLKIANLTLGALQLSDRSIISSRKLIQENERFTVSQFTGSLFNSKSKFRWYNAGLSGIASQVSLDSFFYEPAMERDSFIASRKFQSDYIRLQSGRFTAGPIFTDEWLSDSTLHIGSIRADRVFLSDYKDRSIPFNHGLIKPLPAELLRKIPLRLQADTVQFTHASVDYTEANDKTKRTATIPVRRMTVTLYHVKNIKANATDSLRIHANGYLLDTVWVRLRVKESYSDSLGGFLMTLRMKPGDLRVLNPVLIPMASVKLLSGELDTLSMRAVGREYLALGEMKMYYDDLRIQLLKNGTDSGKTFFTRLANFIANTFIIRKNNHSRTGNVFFIRQRDRSAINYLIKIAISGMASSVGAKNNRRMLRRYQHELEKRKLPPIEME